MSCLLCVSRKLIIFFDVCTSRGVINWFITNVDCHILSVSRTVSLSYLESDLDLSCRSDASPRSLYTNCQPINNLVMYLLPCQGGERLLAVADSDDMLPALSRLTGHGWWVGRCRRSAGVEESFRYLLGSVYTQIASFLYVFIRFGLCLHWEKSTHNSLFVQLADWTCSGTSSGTATRTYNV